jgi:predicted HicB family RNase H-like nuclease
MTRRRPKRRQINLRISEELRRRLELEADSRGVSINWLMTRLLEHGLANKIMPSVEEQYFGILTHAD